MLVAVEVKVFQVAELAELVVEEMEQQAQRQ